MMISMINSTEEVPLKIKKGAWSVEEDQKLIAYIKRYGIWNWNEMPKAAGLLRSGKSCRLRWLNYLRPDVKRGNFSKEEDELILSLHQMLGNRWSAIAAKFPGRTDNEIKNHWHSCLKKKSLKNINNGVQKSDKDSEPKHENYSENSSPSPSSSSSSSINLGQDNDLLSEYLMQLVQDDELIDVDQMTLEDSSILDSQGTEYSPIEPENVPLSGQSQESFDDPMEVMHHVVDDWVQNPLWLQRSFYSYDYQINEPENDFFDYFPLWQ